MTFPARYPGECVECDQRIDVGDPIDAPADGTETELPATPESTGDPAFGLADPVPAPETPADPPGDT